MNNLLAGIDIGTTGLKVAVYTADGQLVDRAYREYSLSFPQSGWVEVDPELWWRELRECMDELFNRGKASLQAVTGIGITCTNSLVLLDGERNALQPAVMQLDQRAVKQAEKLKETCGQDWMFAKTGNRISSGAFWGPALQWIRENRPSIYTKSRYFLVPTSYLILRLTGAYCIDHSRAASTMLYNVHQKNWDPELCELFGFNEDLLPPLLKSHELAGRIDEGGERGTGFLLGTPVVAGGMDSIGALVGLGVGPENGALVMGSVGRICIESDRLDDRFMNTVNYDASNHMIMTPVNSAGVSYKWAKQLFFADVSEDPDIYRKMDQLAETVPPGAEGLMYGPYLTGERAPIWEPLATGSFSGITIQHSRAHFVRAVLEGVGFALARNFEILQKELQVDPTFLLAGGGGACSRLWMQIISDMLGKPLQIPEQLETETMGAAMLAGVGIGLFPDLVAVQKQWVRIAGQIQPRMDIHQVYSGLMERFKEIR